MTRRASSVYRIAASVLVASLFSTPAYAGSAKSDNAAPTHFPSLPMHTDFGGPFQLTDHFGNRFTQDDFLGHYSLLYFGFTNCTDICPIALSTIELSLNTLKPPSGLIVPYLVNLDHKQNSLAELTEYVGYFHKDMIGLTGTAEQLRVIAGAYTVRYKHVHDEDGDQNTVHSGMMFLLNPSGKAIAMLPHEVPQDWLTATLRQHLFGETALSQDANAGTQLHHNSD
jgi:cytochrome oxidase Cu insertion factor (SCO1/SenC/PrrC family)